MKTETGKQEEGNLLLSPLNIVKYSVGIISVVVNFQNNIYLCGVQSHLGGIEKSSIIDDN